MKKMLVLRGCSGSGKSTLAKKLWMLNLGAVILSTDEIYAGHVSGETSPRYLWSAAALKECHFINQVKTENACIAGIETIIIDNTNTTWKEIEPYAKTALKYGYEIEIKEPETDWKANANYLNKMNVHSVPLKVIEAQLGRFESAESIEMKLLMLKGKK